MRDFDNARVRIVSSNDAGRRGIVNDDGSRGGGQALEHRVFEIARVGGRSELDWPTGSCGQAASPFTEIEDEFFDVAGPIEHAQKEMVQRRIVQNHDAGMGKGALVNLSVQMIVADVVERAIRMLCSDAHVAVLAEARQQRRGVIGNASWSWRQGAKKNARASRRAH